MLADVFAEIEAARPALDRESDEFRAAVLLLLSADTGLNVDRLAMRTRYPRESVSRCLRRLSDNALWMDGESTRTWSEDRARSEQFWWDVDVALGRRLRRVDPSSGVEWAPINGWSKDYEYTSRQPDTQPVHNEYRSMPVHDEQQAFSGASAEEEDDVAGPSGVTSPEPAALHQEETLAVPPNDEPEVDDEPAESETPVEAEWLVTLPDRGLTAPGGGALGKEWATADWLT
jgi:hypothetical protein